MKKKGTVSDEIDVQIQHQIQRILYPLKGKIKKVYSDGHVDIEIDNQVIIYVEAIGTPVEANVCLLLFLNGNTDEYIAIC